jgi:multidrug efflux pump
VVVENVERWMARGLSPRDATYKAMEEVTGPIIAVALVLCAVFVPCAFITGITGQFFRQFAITIAVSTIISTVNSLTFSPALAAILLRPHAGHRPGGLGRVYRYTVGGLFGLFNWSSGVGTAAYGWATGRLMRLSALVLLVYAGLLVLTAVTFRAAPKGFIPQQDQGRLIVNVQLSDAAALDRTYETVLRVEKIARETPGVGHTVTNSGMSFLLQANSPNFASMFIVLKPFSERLKAWYQVTGQTAAAVRDDGELGDDDRPPDAVLEKLARLRNKPELGREAFENSLATVLDGDELARYRGAILKHSRVDMRDVAIMARLRARWLREVADAQVTVFGSAPIPGLGTAGGFKFMVEDKGGLGVRALEQRMEDLVDRFKKLPYLADAKTQFRARTPQLYLDVDRAKAASLGVSVQDLNQTVSMYLGSLYVNSYNDFGRHWQVTVQADGRFRTTPEQIHLFQVRNAAGVMIPLSTLVKVRQVGGPISVTRYNLKVAAPINGNVLPGVSDGDAIAAIDKVAAETLPLSMQIEWTELMYLQIKAGDSIYIFMLSVLCVFLALAALYESWTLPLAVILVVPLCLLCSVAGVLVANKDVNVFVQIGLVVLVGLACKNAILIVEFARQLHRPGTSCYAATKEASQLRLRPIVMTSLAFIFGVLPLMSASGAGAEMRRSLGVAVFSGMLGVTLFGIFLTPVFFYVIQGVSASDRFRSPALRAALSYAAAAGLGALFGFLLAKLDSAHPVGGPAVGGCAGVLFIRGVRGFRARIAARRAFPAAFPAAFSGRRPPPPEAAPPPAPPPSPSSGDPVP